MARLNFGTEILKDEKLKDFTSTFKFLPENLKRKYGVVLVFQDEKNKIQIHYEIDIICLGRLNEKDFKFEVFKNQVFINERVPDSIIDVLAERCGNVLYPLQVKVNNIGKVTSILNHNDIKSRWEKEKESIKQSYKGSSYDQIINSMEKVISNPKKVENLFFQRDWFIKLFFVPIYNFNKLSKLDQNIELPFIPYKLPIKYSIKQFANIHPSKNGVIQIKRKGIYNDLRNEKDLKKGNLLSISKDKKATEGMIDLEYLIYKNSPIVDAITGECTLDFASENFKKLKIEIYNLKEKTPSSSLDKKEESLKVEQKIKPPKKRKKMFSFFGK